VALIKKEFVHEKKEPFIIGGQRSAAEPVRTAVPERGTASRPKMEQILTQTEEEIRSRAFEEAQQIKNEALRLRQEAERQAAELLDNSRREGLEAGRQEGWQQVGDYIKEALETVNQSIITKNKIIKSSEPEILKLSIKIAEQIIRSEVSLNRDVCMSIVSEAIGKITDREQVIIRVNQSNLEQVRSQRDRLVSLMDGVKNLTIQEDAGVEPGGCVVETNLGYVDAKIGTKLVAIEEALRKVLPKEEEVPEETPPQEEISEPENGESVDNLAL
jgi:flagellar assembly protein FliH